MHSSPREKNIGVCKKRVQKGNTVGVSFYAFYTNKNDNPELLMEAAT